VQWKGLSAASLALTPALQRLLVRLITAQGLILSHEGLAAAAGIKQRDPEAADKCLKVQVGALRRQLRPLGFGIEAFRGRGYALSLLQELKELKESSPCAST
jgi:DNA-binding response OmpR family regulator